jgi:glycosyltransferase involved in cell wall biosynthesis
VLLTFGLISRKKGIETVIRALPAVVARHPDVIYLVLGKTHPAVLRETGEEYRDSLQHLVEDLHLRDRVIFLNEFTDEERLCRYLTAADIYVTPYLSEAQITSGTLSYAVGAGCAVISTPYWHAQELLADGRGRLFEFNQHEQLSGIFMSLLDHPKTLKRLRDKALEYGREMTWSKIAEKYVRLSQTLVERQSWQPLRRKSVMENLMLPHFSLDHIRYQQDDR